MVFVICFSSRTEKKFEFRKRNLLNEFFVKFGCGCFENSVKVRNTWSHPPSILVSAFVAGLLSPRNMILVSIVLIK